VKIFDREFKELRRSCLPNANAPTVGKLPLILVGDNRRKYELL
jgi:hypothetical protein